MKVQNFWENSKNQLKYNVSIREEKFLSTAETLEK